MEQFVTCEINNKLNTITGRMHENSHSHLQLSVATLNCWLLPHPWPIGSKIKTFRIKKLIEELSKCRYDIVALQEVWSEQVFLEIARALNEVYPYSHYFHSGFTGSGTCVISRHPIVFTLLHRYSLNGFPHHIHRGDWFGGKIVGLAEIMFHQFRLSFYTTHLHAEYNRENDLYLPHRISQCFEMSQFIHGTSGRSDLVILVGDFNLEPNDLGYHLIKNIAGVNDAWECRPNFVDYSVESGMTCDRPDNCFTQKYLLKDSPDGKRLDYIMFRSGRTEIELLECRNCFDKIPETDISYSDHLGVAAKFAIKEVNLHEMQQSDMAKRILNESLKIINEGEGRALWDRRLYLALCIILIALLIFTANIDLTLPSVYAIVALVRFVLTLLIGFSFCYGFVGLTIEMKALKETKYSMRKLLN